MNKHKNAKKFMKLTPLIAGAVIVVSAMISPVMNVRADQFDEQIKALEKLKSQNESEAAELGGRAVKKETEIEKLQNQIAGIQAQIEVNQKRQDVLNKQIEAAQKRLEDQKDLLSANIRSMYIEGDISPLEMLASSKNLGDFVDQQEYRDRIKENITNTLDEIEVLKKQLDDQRKEIVRIIEEKKSQKGALSEKRSEADSKLAALNQSKASFDSKVKAQSTKIAGLRAQQLAANQTALGGNVVAGDPSHGGYPSIWSNAPQDSLVDSWGMYNRECVSYTAWKVFQSGRDMPYWGGHGNANQWPGSAQASGISVSSTPKVGDVAISMSGYYGHAMYVESVSGGQIYVSQYNYQVQGEYSEMWVSASGLQFIHF
jgi:surface antigen